MHDVRDCLVLYRGRVMLEVPGPDDAVRRRVVDPMRLQVLTPRAGEVGRYEGPWPMGLGWAPVEVWRREVERLNTAGEAASDA